MSPFGLIPDGCVNPAAPSTSILVNLDFSAKSLSSSHRLVRVIPATSSGNPNHCYYINTTCFIVLHIAFSTWSFEEGYLKCLRKVSISAISRVKIAADTYSANPDELPLLGTHSTRRGHPP